MKIIFTCLSFIMVSLFCNTLQAQSDPVKERIELLIEEREAIVLAEREKLKTEVENINTQLEVNEITADEARIQKEEAAEKHARNIENKTAIIDNRIALLERNEDLDEDGVLAPGSKTIRIQSSREPKLGFRTVSAPVIAFGLNNLMDSDGNLQDDDIKLAGSRFFEIGWSWKTRVFETSDFLHFTYGISYQFNGLKPTGNRVFVKEGTQTNLEEFPIDLDKSKFRMDNLVIPVHFEFAPFNWVKCKDRGIFSINCFKLGLGGYAGVNVYNMQKLKYRVDGIDHKEKRSGNYNTNDFIYGLSAYMGINPLVVYVKYDLNTVFKDNLTDHHNLSLGLRWDFN
jgi:hypothetical protein